MKTKIMCIFYSKVGTLSGAKLAKTQLRSIASEETTATKRQYARMPHTVVHASPRCWKKSARNWTCGRVDSMRYSVWHRITFTDLGGSNSVYTGRFSTGTKNATFFHQY